MKICYLSIPLCFFAFLSIIAAARPPNTCFQAQIPGAVKPVTTGYLPVNQKNESFLFYSFYPALNLNETEAPVMIWLSGGPGCTDQDDAFNQFGPYYYVLDPATGEYSFYNRSINETWNDKISLLFFDQPVSTGWSILGNPDDETTTSIEAADDFYYVLQEFYSLSTRQDLQCTFFTFQKNPVFLFGNSYGGHWISAFGSKIIEENNKIIAGISNNIYIPLVGAGAGDPWVDGQNQIQFYANFAYNLGFLDFNHFSQAQFLIEQMNYMYRKEEYAEITEEWVNIREFIEMEDGYINNYNIEVVGAYDEESIIEFGESPMIIEMFGVYDEGVEFTYCSNEVWNSYLSDFSISYADSFVEVLENMEVLIYNGQNDLIVNAPSTLFWLSKINWNAAEDFNMAEYNPWELSEEVVGYVKAYDNLKYTFINNAGHMVPKDQPVIAKIMIDNFVNQTLNNLSKDDSAQSLEL